MEKFKPLKELIKALTYIGDAIAGTNKSSNSQGESNNVYDGILEVANGRSKTYFSFGIKDNDNATKLGDLFTDNFINDLNNTDNIDVVSTVTDLLDTKIELRTGSSGGGGIPISLIYKDGSATFADYGTSFNISIVDSTGRIKVEYQITSSKPFTKDTPLQKVSDL